MTLDEIRAFLRNVNSWYPSYSCSDVSAIKNRLSDHKQAAVAVDNQILAKDIWCLEHILKSQIHYIEAFHLMKEGEFYKAWCILEQSEITLHFLLGHYVPSPDEFFIGYIDEKVKGFQSLFPYKIFMSPEILIRERKMHDMRIRSFDQRRVRASYRRDL